MGDLPLSAPGSMIKSKYFPLSLGLKRKGSKKKGEDEEEPRYHRWGQKWHLVQMLVLPFIPIAVVILQTALSLSYLTNYRIEVSEVDTQVTIATELGKVVEQMHLERSEVAFFIFTNGTHTLRTNLTERFRKTDEALDEMSTWPKVVVRTHSSVLHFFNKESFKVNLEEFRNRISKEESSIPEILPWYTSVNSAMLNHMMDQIKETDNSGVWRFLIVLKNLLKCIEHTGVSMVYGINYFGRGSLPHEKYLSFVKHSSIGADLLNGTFVIRPKGP